VDVTIKTDNLKFNIGGNFLFNVADYLIPVFKDYVREQVEAQIEATLTLEIPKVVNAYIQKDNGFYIPWPGSKYANFTIDTSVETNPVVF
jgi:hypothetical protein